MLRTADLDYELPEELIATQPLEERDRARLLVVSRSDPNRLEHRLVRDLPDLLTPGDVMIFNDTRVLPARFVGRRCDTGGRIAGLFVSEAAPPRPAKAPLTAEAATTCRFGPVGPRWSVMLKSNGRLRPGVEVMIERPEGGGGDPSIGGAAHCSLRLLAKQGDTWLVQVNVAEPTHLLLERFGRTPLPPYILRSRRERGGDDSATPEAVDRDHYQTVYAKEAGAIAAPTAGLHFTPELLARLDQRSVRRAFVTLHVGAGTFKPVETEFVEEHPMHRERFSVPAATLEVLHQVVAARATESGKEAGAAPRVFAVGTTSVRTLESLPAPLPVEPASGEADLLISPGFDFRLVDGLLTNFHLPRSTLIALVAALLGLERTMMLYRTAVEERYRFYSYGDAMLILP